MSSFRIFKTPVNVRVCGIILQIIRGLAMLVNLDFSSPAVNRRSWTLLRNTEGALEALTNFARFYDITQNSRIKTTIFIRLQT